MKKTTLTATENPNSQPSSSGKEKEETPEDSLKILREFWAEMKQEEERLLALKGRLLNLVFNHQSIYGPPGFYLNWIETHGIPKATAKRLREKEKKQQEEKK